MNAATLLATILVLTTGDRIDVDGPVRFQGTNAIFRAAGGALYSIPLTEIDLVATEAARNRPEKGAETPKKLKLTPEERKRLLDDLAQNRAGKAAPAEQMKIDDELRTPTKREEIAKNQDEWQWRREARDYDERVAQAEENLQLLRDRIEQLEGEIIAFRASGYTSSQFTYQTSQLQHTRDMIPAAELEVRRAERAREQFRDDARRQGIPPGWLR